MECRLLDWRRLGIVKPLQSPQSTAEPSSGDFYCLRPKVYMYNSLVRPQVTVVRGSAKADRVKLYKCLTHAPRPRYITIVTHTLNRPSTAFMSPMPACVISNVNDVFPGHSAQRETNARKLIVERLSSLLRRREPVASRR